MGTAKEDSAHQLFYFFLLTFAFSWLMWLPGILITYNVILEHPALRVTNNILSWMAGTGPSLAAIILVLRYNGKSGLKPLLKRVFMAKLGRWYFPVLLLLPVTVLAAHQINSFWFNASFPQTGLLREPWWIPVVFIVFLVLQFGEELGWRGYALDRLQTKWTALSSSLIIGSFWAIWHIPMFISAGFGQHDNQLPFHQFFITLVLLSVFITWFQNNTDGSLLPAFITHAFMNLSGELLII